MCSDLVAQDKDIVILRTFSKIYGMAGLRAGAAMGRPDLLDKIRPWSIGSAAGHRDGGGHRQPEIEERWCRSAARSSATCAKTCWHSSTRMNSSTSRRYPTSSWWT